MIRTYSELVKLQTFKERYEYLKLGGLIGEETFGFDRYINQKFYKSQEWKNIRDSVIVRDNGFDLGVQDYPIKGKILIHHINPITSKDIASMSDFLLDPEYLITTSHTTHNAIHYGNDSFIILNTVVERSINDTIPWKR